MPYQSTKVIKGFSTCFRQHRASHSHCRFLHGYALKFKITFEAETLDSRNWVADFGFMKHSKYIFDGKQIGDWFKYMFDHTVIVADDDPALKEFKMLHATCLIQLRTLGTVGCEAFADLVFNVLNLMIKDESRGRVWVKAVECIETEDNSAIKYEK